MDIITISDKRYTTKVYDKTKKIPEEQFKQLRHFLRNCPSSVNSQPWHFIVASTDDAKARVLPAIAEFNQPRVKDASHVIIFCVKTEMDDTHLQKLLQQEEKDGRFGHVQDKHILAEGRKYFVGVNNQTPQELLNWESKQVYIALGSLLFAAASMGIDSTPIEGFSVDKMNEVLGLKEKQLTSVVIASLGYHSEEDFNANLTKSRLSEKELFTVL